MYKAVLTDRDHPLETGTPNSVEYSHKSLSEVFKHLTMLIEDCNLTDVVVKITKKEDE
tara:strand:- start:100 stop:273 length:174 start_codon:yes stop_codon:yes gene_type:complete